MDVFWWLMGVPVWLLDLGATLGWLLIGRQIAILRTGRETAARRLAALAVGLALALGVRGGLIAVFLWSPTSASEFLAQDLLLVIPWAALLVAYVRLAGRWLMARGPRPAGLAPLLHTRRELGAVVLLVVLVMTVSGVELAVRGTTWRRLGGPTGPRRLGYARGRLYKIAECCRDYALQGGGTWPDSLEALVDAGRLLETDLVNRRVDADEGEPWVYLRPPPQPRRGEVPWEEYWRIVVAHEQPHWDTRVGMLVGFTDRRVCFVRDAREFDALFAVSERVRARMAAALAAAPPAGVGATPPERPPPAAAEETALVLQEESPALSTP